VSGIRGQARAGRASDRVRHGRRLRAAVVLPLLAVAVVTAGCGLRSAASSPTPTPDTDAIAVVATTTVLADMVSQVGGTRVDVHSLVPRGGEVHTFDPTPADVERIAHADLIVRNGLGLDDWLAALVEDAGTSAPVIALGEGLDGVTYLEGEGGPGAINPHVWMNVAYGAMYVDRIEAALAAADPGHVTDLAARANAYRAQLMTLDGVIRERLAAIPAQDRNVVSFHDAFPYFADAYGLTIVGTVVDSPGQDPSAGAIGDLIRAMRASGARVIFSEAQFNDALVQAIAADAGAVVVNDLYDDTLGDPPADTYAGMMAWNADRVTEAVGP
jgi:ABC-type Zn uptake system ZnuABC Zn-binding protein ZnuA